MKAHIQITITLETLLGLDDHAAHLTGYGPICAHVARAAALQAGSTWRRLITDPRDGQLLDYGRRTYRPPTALADHIIARDVTCTHPGCPRPAELTDIDHILPYPLGTTSETNLRSLCRRHHRLKHEAGWQAHTSHDPQDPPETVIVTSRTGHHYKIRPPDLRPDDRADQDQERDTLPNSARRKLASRALDALNRAVREEAARDQAVRNQAAREHADDPAQDESVSARVDQPENALRQSDPCQQSAAKSGPDDDVPGTHSSEPPF